MDPVDSVLGFGRVDGYLLRSWDSGNVNHDSLDFHNVAQLVEPDSGRGRLLQRVPESVRADLNEGAQGRVRHPAGVELRFVPDGEVSVTLSVDPGSADASTVRVFWGPFQERVEHDVGADPTTVTVSMPEKLTTLDPDVREELRFDPCVCRLVLPGEHRGGLVRYHGAEGDRRPPESTELPDRTYLAYGTSITEGEAALGEHLTYVNQVASRLGTDAINLGTCGSAYCDPAMAEFIAERDDWDVATLALSVNMVGTFDVDQFRERAAAMVDTVAGANPEKPVFAVTLYLSAKDLCVGHEHAEESERFREALRDVVGESPHENLHLLEGADVLTHVGGLTTDLVHPGDDAFVRMGQNLANELESYQ